jgi:hypothetical protein
MTGSLGLSLLIELFGDAQAALCDPVLLPLHIKLDQP